MASTVKARPNYYETLGLKPTAGIDEIVRAFTTAMGPLRPPSLGGLVEASVAYEVLRNPAKRRAYDASIGLKPEPSLRQRLEAAHFATTVRVRPVERAAIDPLHRPARQPEPRPEPEPAAGQRSAPFIAASRQVQVTRPAPLSPSPKPDQPQRPALKMEPAAPELPPHLLSPQGPAMAADAFPAEWKRAALALGGVVLAVGVLGAVAGWSSGIVEQPKQPEPAVTSALPRATRAPAAAVQPAVQVTEAGFAKPQYARARHRAVAARPVRRAPAQQQQVLTDQQVADIPPVEVHAATGAGANDAAVQAAAETAPAAAAAMEAKLPLSNATIARTIGRIGYPCGRVASTAAGEAPGVFTVTCTSGHSYRAAPVRGRYHFRRLGTQ